MPDANVYEVPVKATDPANQAQPPVNQEAPPQQPTPQPTPQDTNRQEIYNKYYEQDPATNTQEAPPQNVTAPSGEVPNQDTPVPPKTEVAVPNPNEAELRTQIDELKTLVQQTLTNQQQAPLAAAPEPLQPPVVAEPSGNPDEEWIEDYKEGKFEAGARKLAQVVSKYQEPPKDNSQETIAAAVEMVEAKATITQAAAAAAQQHPELVDWQPFIKAAIDADMAQAQTDGHVKSYSDFARIYVEKLNIQVDSASKISQANRASGAENANIRSSEVVSSTVITPQGVTKYGEAPTQSAPTPPANPMESYMNARKTSQLARDGMRMPG